MSQDALEGERKQVTILSPASSPPSAEPLRSPTVGATVAPRLVSFESGQARRVPCLVIGIATGYHGNGVSSAPHEHG